MGTSRMRVLHVVSRLNYGGAAALIFQWLSYLHNAGHDVEVCVIYSKGQFADKLEEEGIVVHSLALDPDGKTYQPKGKYNFFALIPLIRLIRGGKYDIVHAHLFPTSLFVSIVSLIVKKPVIIFSEHSVSNHRRRYRIFKVLDWLIYKRYSKIVAVSEEVQDSLLRWLPGLKKKALVIPNSIDPKKIEVSEKKVEKLRKELGITNECRVILYAGRLLPVKGPDILLEALENLIDDERPLKVLIAGDGPLLSQLQQRTTGVLDGRVTFLGLQNDVPTLLGVADLLVLPSRWEGLPMILLEAMASRTPIIATAVGGIPGVIEHKVNGWLVPPLDAKSLADGIITLLNSEELCDKFAENAYRKVCDHYSVDAAVKKLLNVYNRAIEDKSVIS